MEDKVVNVGTTIKDRFGNEHKAYSVMWRDKEKLREMVPKINSVVLIDNMMAVDGKGGFDNSPYETVIDIVQMSLRKDDEAKYTKKEIESFLDAELARKIIRVYLDIEGV